MTDHIEAEAIEPGTSLPKPEPVDLWINLIWLVPAGETRGFWALGWSHKTRMGIERRIMQSPYPCKLVHIVEASDAEAE